MTNKIHGLRKKKWEIVLTLMMLFHFKAFAVINVTLPAAPYNTVRLTGAVDGNIQQNPLGVTWCNINFTLQLNHASGYYEYTSVINTSTYTTVAQFRNQANSMLSGGITLPHQGPSPAPPGAFSGSAVVAIIGWCGAYQFHAYPTVVIVNPPPPPVPDSVCSLNSQNVPTLDYSSSVLNVAGLSQSQNLNISCTTGTAKNYRLRLTGSNATSGRLNFGNGVSAQIYLNGAAVSANAATGISMNGLTSRTITVRGDLVGTASGPGVTNAYGVLILEAF